MLQTVTIPCSQDLPGLLLHCEHRLRDLADWVGRVNLPSEYRVNLFVCEVHANNVIKPSLELSVKFPHYKDALAWAYLYCKHHDENKGVDGRTMHSDNGGFGMQLIDFDVTCLFPSETYPAALLRVNGALTPAN